MSGHAFSITSRGFRCKNLFQREYARTALSPPPFTPPGGGVHSDVFFKFLLLPNCRDYFLIKANSWMLLPAFFLSFGLLIALHIKRKARKNH